MRLITWNIQCARTPEGPADLDRVVDRVRAFDDRFDVLLLQEVGCGLAARDGSPTGDQFAGLARRLEHLHAASAFALDARNADGSPRRLGCMTFARAPILLVRRHALPWPPDPDAAGMPRAALDTVVAARGGPLRVLNVHLEYFSQRQRMAQVGRLRELQAEARAYARIPAASASAPASESASSAAPAPPDAAILAGDFNMLPGSDCHARLLAPGADGEPLWHDAWPLARSGQPHAPTVGLRDRAPGAAPFTFDYACVSAALAARVRAVRVDTDAVGSDHQPLLLELA